MKLGVAVLAILVALALGWTLVERIPAGLPPRADLPLGAWEPSPGLEATPLVGGLILEAEVDPAPALALAAALLGAEELPLAIAVALADGMGSLVVDQAPYLWAVDRGPIATTTVELMLGSDQGTPLGSAPIVLPRRQAPTIDRPLQGDLTASRLVATVTVRRRSAWRADDLDARRTAAVPVGRVITVSGIRGREVACADAGCAEVSGR